MKQQQEFSNVVLQYVGSQKKTISIISLIVIDWGHPEYRKKCRKKRMCSGTGRMMNRDMNTGFVGKWGGKIERVWHYKVVMVTQHFESPKCSQIATIMIKFINKNLMKKIQKAKKKKKATQESSRKTKWKDSQGKGTQSPLGGERVDGIHGGQTGIEAAEPALPLDMVFLEMEVERHLGLCP